jgi:hypothetical protein
MHYWFLSSPAYNIAQINNILGVVGLCVTSMCKWVAMS